MKLVFDTETTGLARFDLPVNDPSQPRLVQLGMILLSDDNEVCGEFGCIVKPEGFIIPEGAAAIHGITTERALRDGINNLEAISFFQVFSSYCDTIIGHNLRFDKIVIEHELSLYGTTDWFKHSEFCTMINSTGQLMIPKRGGGYKWPKLSECMKYYFHEDYENKAHNALNDVRATARIYKQMMIIASGSINADTLTRAPEQNPDRIIKQPSREECEQVVDAVMKPLYEP